MELIIENKYNSLNNSTSTNKSNSITSQVTSSENVVKTISSHTIKFVMEDGMAEAAYVDGIKMDLADMFLTNKSQLKERINEKYNKTDAEKLEEAFNL